MKPFFGWLFAQAIFARILIGMILGLWEKLHLKEETLVSLVLYSALLCAVEAIVSCIVVYPLIEAERNRR